MSEELESLRLRTLEIVKKKLDGMLDDCAHQRWFEKCPIKHISEMVKLYHQAKSLEK